MNFLLVLVLLHSFLCTEQSNPLKDPHICGSATCTSDRKFKYEPGTQFEYDYETRINSLFIGNDNKSSIFITSRIHLEFTSKCDGTITFDQLRLYKSSENEIDSEVPSSESRRFEEAIRENSIRFEFQDGVINEVCPEDDEVTWVLNFKRGLLSMLQNSMKRFDLDHQYVERDVHGTCMSSYKVVGVEGTSLVIHKSRDINSCTDRHKHHSVLQTVPYRTSANYTGSVVLNSEVGCELLIDHHIYKSIECKESHVFHPLSDSSTGASTEIHQKLTLLSENNYGRTLHYVSVHRRNSLLYDHEQPHELSPNELKSARDLMKSMCRLGSSDMNLEPSNTFGQFVHVCRSLSYISLHQLYTRSTIVCPTGRKHLLDVLPFVASDASFQLMTKLMIERKIPKSTAEEWLIALGLTPRPTNDMLTSLLDLIEYDSEDPNIALSISSICRTYCKYKDNCQENETIKRLLHLGEQRITLAYHSRKSDRKTKETILGWLKAIGNIGMSSEKLQAVMMEIIKDNEVDTEVRVAAVSAFRRFPIGSHLEEFVRIVQDFRMDAEVRIGSYLHLMQDPDQFIIGIVKHVLEVEEVNQVGSFIWSHLHNVIKSANPSRVEVQGLLSDKDLGRKFNSDVRKFSRNFEGSVFFEELNIGGSYESNVIFSPSSYIPRSLSLNFSVNMYQESINLLEVTTYLQGFEHSLEGFFGPKGRFDTSKFIKKTTQRFVRNVNATTALDRLQNDLQRFPNILNDRVNEPQVSFAIRVFGNDIKYVTFNGYGEINQVLNRLNPLNQFRRLFSGKEILFDRATMLLDASHTVPTGAGFPMTLNALGTSAVKLKLYGSLRGADFMSTKQLDLLGSVYPRVAIDVIGSMTVNAYHASTGIKLKTSVLSSAAVEGHIKLQVPNQFSIKFSLPNDRTDILLIRSDIVVMKDREEEYQTGVVTDALIRTLCSWPAVDNTIGLKLCLEYQLPNVFSENASQNFLLSGPTKLHFSLKKQDPTAKIYLMEYNWVKTNKSSMIGLVFDTPGSAVKRLLMANLTLDTESHNLTLFLETSGGTTLAKGKYKNSPDEKYIYVGLDINGQKHFDARASINRTASNNGYIYHPYIYLGVNNDRVAQLNGEVQKMFKKNISLYDINLKFQTKRLSTNLVGYVSRSEASIETRLRMGYQFVNETNQTISFECKFSDRSTVYISSYQGNLRFLSSAHQHYNIDSTLKIQAASGHFDAIVHLNTGLELDKPKHTLVAQYVFMISDVENGKRVNTYLKVRKPANNLDWKLHFRFEQIGSTFDTFVSIKYATDKEITVTLFLDLPPTALTNIEGRLNVTIPSFVPMCLEGKIHERVINEFDIDVKIVWFSGHEIRGRGKYQDKSSRYMLDHSLKLLIQSESFPEIYVVGQYQRNEVQLRVEAKVTHSGGESSLLLQHASVSPYEIDSTVEVRHAKKVYSLSCRFSLQEYRQVGLELHIDQWRDIHLGVRSLNRVDSKELGVEFKWDANRDPDQKLMMYVEYNKPQPYRYTSKFDLSYPGRSVNGIFDVLFQLKKSKSFGRLSWSQKEFIEVNLSSDYDFDTGVSIGVNSELLTSFESWKKTSFNARIEQSGNTCHVNTSIHWPLVGYLSVDIYGNYVLSFDRFSCEFKSDVQSTIEQIPPMYAALKHEFNTNKTISDVKLKYRPDREITVRSEWETHREIDFKQILGTIKLTSPFPGYSNGLLQSEFYMFKNRHVTGLIDLELDSKMYTLTLEGHYIKLTNNTLVFNITTPVVKYEKITGRFGFSEDNRHLVAEIRTPINAIGVEFLFVINNITDYDIKCSVASPLEFLQTGLVLGKLTSDQADYRLGWNNLQAGFTAMWQYKNLTNFQYVYKLYTPITMYEENGVVAKLIVSKGVDIEFSLKLASSKLGLAVTGRPKVTFITTGLKTIGKRVNVGATPFVVSDTSWVATAELDLIVYQTLRANIDFDKKGPTYFINAAVILPDGTIHIANECTLYRLSSLSNKLQVKTPYVVFKEFNLNSTLDFINKENDLYANIVLDGIYVNNTLPIKVFLDGWCNYYRNYELHRFNGSLHLAIPFEIVPSVRTRGVFEIDENSCKVNFTLDTNNTKVVIAGTGEVDDGCIDADLNYTVTSPLVTLPKTHLHLKKDFNEIENTLSVLIEIHPKIPNENFVIRSLCQAKSLRQFNVEIGTKLPVHPLQHIDWRLSIDAVSNVKSLLANFAVLSNSIVTSGKLTGNYLMFQIDSNILQKQYNLDFDGHFTENNRLYSLTGTLSYNNIPFNVLGSFNVGRNPKVFDLVLTPPKSQGEVKIHSEVQLQPVGYVSTSSIQQGKSLYNVNVNITRRNGWVLTADVKTTKQIYGVLTVNLTSLTMNNFSLIVNASTPITNFERCGLYLRFSGGETNGTAGFESYGSVTRSSLWVGWDWLVAEKVGVNVEGRRVIGTNVRDAHLNLYYLDPNLNLRDVKFGGLIRMDGTWMLGTDLRLMRESLNNFYVAANVKVPVPKSESYSLECSGKTIDKYKDNKILYNIKYYTRESKKIYGATASLNRTTKGFFTKTNVTDGNFAVQWGPSEYQHVNNFVHIEQIKNDYDVTYRLKTPKFFKEDTIVSRVYHKDNTPFRNISVDLYFPESRKVGGGNVYFETLSNMKGFFNVSTPWKKIRHVGSKFNIETKKDYGSRVLNSFWANSTAVLESKYNCTIENGIDSCSGTMLLEVPIATRHRTEVNYQYKQDVAYTDGNATLSYNKKQMIFGTYRSRSEQTGDQTKNTVQVEIENEPYPIGITYVHRIEPKVTYVNDWKRMEVYKLHNVTDFNITGEIHLVVTPNSQNVTISASHANKTVTVQADYSTGNNSFIHRSRIELNPDVWVAYRLNTTKDITDDFESRLVQIQLLYPRRNFTLFGRYNITDNTLSSGASLFWFANARPRSVTAGVDWEKVKSQHPHHRLELRLEHPSFSRNASLRGEFQSDDTRLGDVNVDLIYSDDPEKELVFRGLLERESNSTNQHVMYKIVSRHPDTRLDLHSHGYLDYNLMRRYGYLYNNAHYQRTFIPREYGTIESKLDLIQNLFEYNKKTRTVFNAVYAKYTSAYPEYKASMFRSLGSENNQTGDFYMNFDEKIVKFDLNMTDEDSFHILGDIPDSRRASFNVWTDYDDLCITDISYFLKLNHSRLIVSIFKWRPELAEEIRGGIREMMNDVSGNVSETFDYWKQYIRTELRDSVKDIWENAEPCIEPIINDFKALRVIKEDSDVFIQYLNDSYNENEFYMKDIFAFVNSVIDEMSIRSHVESLPAVISEIWDAMGESGKVIRQSISWIIETINNSIERVTMLLNTLMQEDAMERLMAMSEHFLENYDKFIKDLHVSFIKSVETLWEKMYVSLMNQWHDLLRSLEPGFIELAHYVESLVYSGTKEFLDFIYTQTNELVDSPYFNRFTNFTADVDKFYRDLTSNDWFTIIYKYSRVAYNFIRDKYFSVVPFGRELQNVAGEIVTELKELQKLPSIRFVTNKAKDFYQQLKQIYDYFRISDRIRYVYNLIRTKMTDVTETALQSENRYRQAKTKFVFDPIKGVIHFEQKLPVSWHSFNQTPEVSEIEEYAAITQMFTYFQNSNFTLWTLYHYWQSFMDMTNVVPPFSQVAIIGGAQNLVTFDGNVYEFKGECSYVLAHDFQDGNFSVIVSYEEDSYKLYLIVSNTMMLQIDMKQNMIKSSNENVMKLPYIQDGTYIYQEADILTIHNDNGYTLRCYFEHDVCVFEVSGWYFGKTAGLWGTMNNEPYDDFTSSSKQIASQQQLPYFAHSWSVNGVCPSMANHAVTTPSSDLNVTELCESFFLSKVSSLHNCFQKIPPESYFRLCLASGDEMKVCGMAIAYKSACAAESIHVGVPDMCVSCGLWNGTRVGQGGKIKWKQDRNKVSADVVFLVEAKKCNQILNRKKNMDTIITALEKEMNHMGIQNTRYAVVVFGGDKVYYEPRSVVSENKFFVSAQEILKYLDNIPTGNGTSDIFNAINFASRLIFRPGASKTFILLPCSDCAQYHMRKLDYTATRHLLHERLITLHILMDKEFIYQKARTTKIFYGMDQEYAYTKKDVISFKGDKDLRNQVKIPKEYIGLCAPLALETNGTVFSSKKMEGDVTMDLKKFAGVFSKRVVKTAGTNRCQDCECTADDDGTTYFECYLCHDSVSPTFGDAELPEQTGDVIGEEFYEDISEEDE